MYTCIKTVGWVTAGRATTKMQHLAPTPRRFAGSTGEHLQRVIRAIAAERQTAGSLDRKGACFKLRAKINDNSLA